MRRADKSSYLIIALLCLIMLNIGSMGIVLGKNPREFEKNQLDLIDKIKSTFSFKDPTKDTVSRSSSRNNSTSHIEDEFHLFDDEIEIYDEFIIIDALDEYENLIIVKDSEGKHIVENLPELLKVNKLNYDKSKPYIFIHHTHATEAFAEHKNDGYRSKDNKDNMVSIGELLAKALEGAGHNVIHSKVQHDNPSYNQSYSRSLNTVKKAMEDEKNLRVILDLHRDARDPKPEEYDKVRAQTRTKIDGKDVARFSLVVGPESQNYEHVLSFAKYIKAVSDAIYPNLCSGIIIKKYGRFNQFVSDYAALVEVGYNLNTYDEVRETAKLIGEILDVAIRSVGQPQEAND